MPTSGLLSKRLSLQVCWAMTSVSSRTSTTKSWSRCCSRRLPATLLTPCMLPPLPTSLQVAPCCVWAQDEFVAMFLEQWRGSEEFQQYEMEVEITNNPVEGYPSDSEAEPVPGSWSEVGSPCYLPPPPDDDGGDPYDGYSADMFYDKPGDSGDESSALQSQESGVRVRVALRVRYGRSVEVRLSLPRVDYDNDYEQMCEGELERQEYIATVTGRPWHEAPEGTVGGRDWTDFTVQARADLHAWSVARVRMRSSTVQEQSPPPYRDDPMYGPRAGNSDGDARFRKDRMLWFERFTRESLEDVPLAEQWQRADRAARAFRAHTRDGRPGRSRDP